MKINKIFKHAIFLIILVFIPFVTFGNAVFEGKISDKDITKNVKQRLLHEPTLKDSDILISTENGVVTLLGVVNTKKEIEVATKVTKTIPGVVGVSTTNLIEEPSEHPLSDLVLTTRVKMLFLKEKVTGESFEAPNISIQVETKDGIVHLTGSTQTQAQLKKAIDLAESVEGVKGVDSKVVIKK